MNKRSISPWSNLKGQKLLSLSSSETVPTAHEMADFAAQFSSHEWERLCHDPLFLTAIHDDLVEACAISSALLGRDVDVFIAGKKY